MHAPGCKLFDEIGTEFAFVKFNFGDIGVSFFASVDKRHPAKLTIHVGPKAQHILLAGCVRAQNKRVFPSIDITRSGTRKEELLVAPDILKKMYVLRRILNPMGTVDAIEFLLGKLRETPKGNSSFFESMNT